MAPDYTEYLAAHVLNEQQIISYRLLSRALKVHVNLAKQMLYDFHCTQNAKKPASVHATYLIAGTRRVAVPSPSPPTNGTHTSTNDDDDTIMRSSPPLPSSSIPHPDSSQPSEQEPQLIRSIMLVKEEHLPQAKASFDQISSIHIYSLEAHPLNDLQVLTECNRKVAADYASEDPLEAWKQYGTIQNSGTKRRTRRNGPPPPQPAPAAVASAVKKEDGKAKQTPPTTSKAEPKATTNDTHAAPASKPAQTKRQNSDIFKSFAKSKTKPKGSESQTTTSASPAAEPKDEAMGGFSDDNGDDDDDEDPPAEPATDGTTGKSKKERAAELQAMMDADEDDPDEEMQDADTPAAEAQPEEPEEEEEEEPSAPLDAPLKKPAADTKESETVTVENGRRRGRRRVMKKRTVKDEEGYLVTKEEAVWESFSEDEPPAKKARLPSAATAGANKGAPQAQKKGGKPGQGNIMAFFGKK